MWMGHLFYIFSLKGSPTWREDVYLRFENNLTIYGIETIAKNSFDVFTVGWFFSCRLYHCNPLDGSTNSITDTLF